MKENELVIGIDHGYGYMKTANTIMKSGVKEQAVEPYFKHNVLRYKERIYVVGQDRSNHGADKAATEEYYLLTLAAIACELKKQNQKQGTIILAAGLPYSFLSQQGKSFKEYLRKNPVVNYVYEETAYNIRLKDAYIFPQGFPVIAPNLAGDMEKLSREMEKLSVVDIGSRTVDILTFVNGNAKYEACFSLDRKGVLDCVEAIQRAFVSKYQQTLDEDLIQRYFQGKDTQNLAPEKEALMKKIIQMYVKEILDGLEARNIQLELDNITFCGGGVSLFRQAGQNDKLLQRSNITILEDIHANAKGYETLCKKMLKQKDTVQ